MCLSVIYHLDYFALQSVIDTHCIKLSSVLPSFLTGLCWVEKMSSLKSDLSGCDFPLLLIALVALGFYPPFRWCGMVLWCTS